MGLDMYLTLNVCVRDQEQTKSVQQAMGNLFVPLKSIKNIAFEAAYWRKANQIHKWFVDNVQHGEDDCGRYYVSHEQLETLVALCREVQGDTAKAAKLLPTSSGCFYGSQDIDDGYWYDIQITIDQLTNALSVADEYGYFTYESSW
jgi:hypothetical protein